MSAFVIVAYNTTILANDEEILSPWFMFIRYI